MLAVVGLADVARASTVDRGLSRTCHHITGGSSQSGVGRRKDGACSLPPFLSAIALGAPDVRVIVRNALFPEEGKHSVASLSAKPNPLAAPIELEAPVGPFH